MITCGNSSNKTSFSSSITVAAVRSELHVQTQWEKWEEIQRRKNFKLKIWERVIEDPIKDTTSQKSKT